MSTRIATYFRGEKEVVEPYELTTMSWNLNENGVLLLQFTVPAALNPLTFIWVAEIYFCLEHAERLNDVKVVVLTGSWRSFSAGSSVELLSWLRKGKSRHR